MLAPTCAAEVALGRGGTAWGFPQLLAAISCSGVPAQLDQGFHLWRALAGVAEFVLLGALSGAMLAASIVGLRVRARTAALVLGAFVWPVVLFFPAWLVLQHLVLHSVLPALEAVDATVRQIRQTVGRKSVAITTWASFAAMWLIPRLQDFQLRCRIEMLPGLPLDLADFRPLLALVLAGVSEALEARPEWQEALALAGALPEDRRGAYLLLARAALEGAPCPSDLAIARVLGSVSRGRGRSALDFLEKQGVIASRPDPAGRRIVTLIGPGWETAPGDPEAAAA